MYKRLYEHFHHTNLTLVIQVVNRISKQKWEHLEMNVSKRTNVYDHARYEHTYYTQTYYSLSDAQNNNPIF